VFYFCGVPPCAFYLYPGMHETGHGPNLIGFEVMNFSV